MFKSNYFKAVLLALALAALAGCDSIPFIDNSSDYKGASRGKPLEVPPDLTALSTDDAYAVPGSTTYSAYNQDQGGKQEQAEVLLPEADSVKFERAGSQRWLVVKAPPEKVWPVVREFWTDLGFAVRVEDSKTGVMETEWIDPADLAKDEKGNYLDKFQGWLDKLEGLNNRQKFRTRLDRGEEEGITEIYMSHRSISNAPDDGRVRVRTVYGDIDTGYKNEDFAKNKSKDARAASEDIDAELLRRLMVKLGVAEKQSRAIIANPSQEKRAAINKATDGSVTLALNDQFDRAWRRVGLALDRVGFLVEDRNRSQGLFYVRYSDLEIDAPSDEKKKGLLDKLKFWGDDDKKAEPKPEPKKEEKGVVDKLKFWENDKDKAAAELQYRVKLDRAGEGTEVTVVDKDGKRDKSSTAGRILGMLYEQLK
ncbi:MAG TPA: outer membrane protein assembly factor BamC [Novimethylophilus sp.]|jgi:outer membrane protein assembly factor BamC|uniref:outer membrane protein assembly factor BamC n=1 Tax=Novimethylophilus sp. TaxID=2137426 RepID=UPI002F428D20